jgi:hypothetical protein
VAILALGSVMVLASWWTPTMSTAGVASSNSDWTKVPFDATGLDAGTTIEAMIEFRGSLLAAGWFASRSPGTVPFQAAVWTSADGRRWQRSATAAFGAGRVIAIAGTDDSVVAFVDPVGNDNQDRHTTVWSSADGSNWRLLSNAGPGNVQDVIAYDGRFVATGADYSDCAQTTPSCVRTAIWSSRDGAQWALAGPKTAFPSGVVTGLVATPTSLIAVGIPTTGTPARRPVYVWTSSDGEQWRRVTRVRGIPRGSYLSGTIAARRATVMTIGVEVSSNASQTTPTTVPTTRPVATSPPGTGSTSVVRLCAELRGTATAWTTVDGRRWERAGTAAGGNSNVNSILNVGNRWLLGGSQGDCSSTRPVIYESKDGKRWDLVESDPAAAPADPNGPVRYVNLLARTATGSTVAVVSTLAGFTTGDGPDIWIRPPD